jgi:multicomponent K+:H+ antiporter subunit E
MKSVLPAPLLSVTLFALWLVLNQSLSAAHILLGVALALAAPLLSAPLRPLPVRIRRPRMVLRLILTVVHDVLVSNLKVGLAVFRLGRRRPNSTFVKVPLDLRDANGLAVLAIITTIVPGTVWSELALDRSALLLHVFDLDEETVFVADFKRRYERPLREIFE